MKLTSLRALALCSLVATLTPLGLSAAEAVHFTIPFAFTVGKTSLPAGSYRVNEVLPSAFRIEGPSSAVIVLAHIDEPGKTPGRTVLTFHQYGQRYFLSTMADSNKGWAMPKSNQEKELLAARPVPLSLGIVASNK